MNANEAILMAWTHEKSGNFDAAIRLYRVALDFYLYKMMWSIKNDSVQKVVCAISHCHMSIAASRLMRAAKAGAA